MLFLVSACGLAACHHDTPQTAPPPDARRPVLKTEAELAAERDARIASGAVVATESPTIQPANSTETPVRRLPPPITPGPGAIEADILIVNDKMVTAADVLFPLWDELEQTRQEQTLAGFRSRARELITREVRREIGSLLVYGEAMAALQEEQLGPLNAAVDKQLDEIITRQYGASKARLTAELTRRGVTMDEFRSRLKRDMVVQQYTREKMMPKVEVTRADLMAYYQDHRAEFAKPETRELLLMEFPFDAYLPAGQTWDRSTSAARAQARLQAMRQARAAHEALATRSFEDVTREFSKGLHADQGGSWGMIGRPLQAPYDKTSGLIFEYATGQTSEPIETETGWYIVKCGKIDAAEQRSFADVQDELRKQLMDYRFARLSTDYVLHLAETATFSSLDRFVNAAVERAEAGTKPVASAQQRP